jgi:DNA replication protein DnaC
MKTPDTARIKIAISKMLSHIKNGPDAIVIVDHDKGGVTKDLISILLDECTKKYGDNIKKCRWYVRTKNYEADWLNVVKENANVNLKLILAGPMLLNLDKDPWFLGSHLSTGALKWLYNQANIEIENNKPRDPQKVDKMNQPIVVAFHEDNSMAAIVPSHNLDASIKDKDNEHTPSAAQETAVFIAKRYPKAPNYKVGRTSVLFSSLVAAMEVSTTSGTNDVRLKINEEDFEKALKQSYTWCKTIEKEFNKEIFSEDINTNLRSHYSNAIKNDESMKWQGDFEIKRRTLKHELKCWAEAFDPDKLGIVNQSTVTESLSKQHPQGKIQLWRGWSPVKGYISLVEENRRLIAKLLAGIKDFKEDKHHQRPLSSLVIGGPGSGKSYLVSKLAEQLDIEYREFNITQLASIDDLMACFDTISSIQTQKPDKSLMVFWDEINAPLGTHAVYSYFLGPIWNGVYRRGGQTFQLKPCIWIFAGTREIEADNKSRGDADFSKGSDFMSRINGPIINLINYEKTINSQQYKQLQVTAQEKGLQQIEQMYMAVSIVKRHFPHVFYISKESLKCFRDIELKYGIRSLEFLILKMKDIKNGKLNKHNFPKFEEISVWIENPDAFDAIMKGKIEPQEIDDDNYVRIYNEP